MTACLWVVGIILLAIAAGCRVAYLESKQMPAPIEVEVKTQCSEQVSMILRSIPHALSRLSPVEFMKFKLMLIESSKLSSHPTELTADDVFGLCAIVGHLIADQAKADCEKKQAEIVRGN